ncbi:DUF421 domain-containing protein [Anoxybacteroides tepidamans]|uniref:DUF421 domain-containing protein n=1 Tax=Anoxybacteroides tepidamans TaxID=265948 RepID=UPI00047F1142|nr:DUF421 domain-containing protein [Anoxybacillus tepidamans]
MDFSFIWKSFVLVLSGILLLRISGRKSIAQMTLAPTVMMISLGTIIVQPIVEKSIVKTIIGAGILVISVLILEYLELKLNFVETFMTGKSKIVVENGKLNVQNLKKLRITVDQLEMRMREQGIAKFEDIKIATIEPNGQLGYELQDEAKPLTVGEFKKLMGLFMTQPMTFAQSTDSSKRNLQGEINQNANIFGEISSSQQKTPEYLQ